ncbi:hypothetical protein MED121_04023 [Marinomonas sp. MED121]|nr:hypothetical protein MED121_04023 [Marinomonas sp. MED121]
MSTKGALKKVERIIGNILADITAATNPGLSDISRINQGMATSVSALPKIVMPLRLNRVKIGQENRLVARLDSRFIKILFKLTSLISCSERHILS